MKFCCYSTRQYCCRRKIDTGTYIVDEFIKWLVETSVLFKNFKIKTNDCIIILEKKDSWVKILILVFYVNSRSFYVFIKKLRILLQNKVLITIRIINSKIAIILSKIGFCKMLIIMYLENAYSFLIWFQNIYRWSHSQFPLHYCNLHGWWFSGGIYI